MNLTLKEITSERDWTGQYGDMHAFKILFSDGTHAEVTTKAATVEKRRTELQALIGKPGEYTLEDQGDFPDGKPKPKKVTDYPGKPKGTGDSRGGGLSLEDRLQLDSFKEAGTNARTAVMQAMARAIEARKYVTEPPSLDEVLIDAAHILDWLQTRPEPGVRNTPSPRHGSGDGSGSQTSPGSAPQSSGSASEYEASPSEASGQADAPGALAGELPSTDPEPVRGGGDGEGLAPSAHSHSFSAEPFEHDGKPFTPRKGWEVCTGCLDARKAAA